MSIRLPLEEVLSVQNNGNLGVSSVSGGIATEFTIPQDADNVVVKFTASTAGGGVSTVLQTTDDGGTTWYDVARTSVVSNANDTIAQWISAPVIGAGLRTAVTYAEASIITAGIGSAAASTLAAGQLTGLPILSQRGRVFLITSAGITTVSSVTTKVMVNSQSATA